MKWTVALLASMALLIPGAAVASASSTGCSYKHNCSLTKVDHASAHRGPSSPSTTPSTAPTTAAKTPGVVQAANATRSTSTGSLPFTGLDIGGLAAGAVILLGAGLMLRRVSAAPRR